MSKVVLFFLNRIIKNENTLNVCTGDVIEKLARKSSDRTEQFVDLMIEKNKVMVETTYQKEELLKLLFVGRVVEDKGIFDLIHAINKTSANTKLTVVGDGPDLKNAKDLAIKLNVAEKVIFMGQVTHGELDEIYANNHITIVPSNNDYEGFPRVIMESWSQYKPVIVTKVGGVNAFVSQLENGIIIQRGDVKEIINAIESIYYSNDLYQQLLNGVKDVHHMSNRAYWAKKLKEWMREYFNEK